MAQAFDRVWHSGLLFKINTLLPPYYYLIFKSYLQERYFSVQSGQELLDITPIRAGVPQGAVAALTFQSIHL